MTTRNSYYFRVESREQTHTFLACLFLVRPPVPLLFAPSNLLSRPKADLISREEAEIVLAKASPAAGSSAFLGTRARLRETIHRLPSLATLGGAYWAGQAFTAEVLATSSTFAGAASATLLSTAPVAVGCLAVGGAMMLFSRSASAKRQVVGDEAMVETEGQEGEATGLVVWEGVRRRVDTDLIRTLTDHELAGESSWGIFAPQGAVLTEELLLARHPGVCEARGGLFGRAGCEEDPPAASRRCEGR